MDNSNPVEPLFGEVRRADFDLQARIKLTVAGVMACIVGNPKRRQHALALTQSNAFEPAGSKSAGYIPGQLSGHSCDQPRSRTTYPGSHGSDECCSPYRPVRTTLSQQHISGGAADSDHFGTESVWSLASVQRRRPSPKVPVR